jgi:hypothetical protein
MGSKSNVMVLADSLHHDDMRNISTNFGWSNILDLIMKSLHRHRYARRHKNYWRGGGFLLNFTQRSTPYIDVHEIIIKVCSDINGCI